MLNSVNFNKIFMMTSTCLNALNWLLRYLHSWASEQVYLTEWVHKELKAQSGPGRRLSLKVLDAVMVPAECAEEGMLFVLQSGTDSHIGQGRKMIGDGRTDWASASGQIRLECGMTDSRPATWHFDNEPQFVQKRKAGGRSLCLCNVHDSNFRHALCWLTSLSCINNFRFVNWQM